MIRYNLTQEQKETLADDTRSTGLDILNINFTDPATDQQLIRHHAYLRGRFDTLKEILEDNFPDPEPEQQV